MFDKQWNDLLWEYDLLFLIHAVQETKLYECSTSRSFFVLISEQFLVIYHMKIAASFMSS